MLNTKLAAVCGVAVLLFGATACGNGDDPQNTDAQAQPRTDSQGAPGDATRQGFPGADGKVAAVDGSTAQVQSTVAGQVAVTWNASTTFTKQISADLDDIRTGVCVMVQSGDDTAASDGSVQTEVTASTVRITEKTDGSCTGGLRGPGAGGPGGDAPQFSGEAPPDGELPEGVQPPGDGSGRPQVRAFGGAFGEVTAVSATGFTVKSTLPQFNGSGSTPTTEETTITVSVTGDTTYTTTAKGSASDVEVGACLRAEGTTDDTGAVTAKTIAMTPATAEGECGGGFLRRSGGPTGGTGATTQES